jgi:hypothetical protein
VGLIQGELTPFQGGTVYRTVPGVETGLKPRAEPRGIRTIPPTSSWRQSGRVKYRRRSLSFSFDVSLFVLDHVNAAYLTCPSEHSPDFPRNLFLVPRFRFFNRNRTRARPRPRPRPLLLPAQARNLYEASYNKLAPMGLKPRAEPRGPSGA